MQATSIWMNGKLRPWDEATVHVGTHALHYGTGVFEGIRAYQTKRGPAIFRLEDHLKRLEESARLYKMPMPYTVQELTQATWEVIHSNKFDSCYVRPIAFRGLNKLGLYPLDCPVDVAVMAWQWGAYLGDDALKHGIRATISHVRRFSNDMMPTQAKACGHYLNSILAKLDASERGFEEAIMLNNDGMLAEGSGENIFVVKDGVVYTPTTEDSILQGITRKTVLEICEVEKIPVITKSLSTDELFAADEIFVTGTAAEITPVRSVDDTVIGEPGPISTKVQTVYFDIVNARDERFIHHLSFC